MDKNIVFRTIIEVLGKPKEHVEQSLNDYVQNLKNNANYEIVKEDFAEIKKQEKDELWACFVELEIKTAKVENITFFCFQYMPSMIEIIEPEELVFSEREFSLFLNDLQTRLHQVDFLAKQLKLENDHIKKNMVNLLKNYIIVLLYRGPQTGENLSKLTGLTQDNLEDFLDQLIDEGKIDLKDKHYFIKE